MSNVLKTDKTPISRISNQTTSSSQQARGSSETIAQSKGRKHHTKKKKKNTYSALRFLLGPFPLPPDGCLLLFFFSVAPASSNSWSSISSSRSDIFASFFKFLFLGLGKQVQYDPNSKWTTKTTLSNGFVGVYNVGPRSFFLQSEFRRMGASAF